MSSRARFLWGGPSRRCISFSDVEMGTPENQDWRLLHALGARTAPILHTPRLPYTADLTLLFFGFITMILGARAAGMMRKRVTGCGMQDTGPYNMSSYNNRSRTCARSMCRGSCNGTYSRTPPFHRVVNHFISTATCSESGISRHQRCACHTSFAASA